MQNKLIALKQLDQQLGTLKTLTTKLTPKQGWIRTIRKALGMTIRQLGKRLHLTSSRITKLESAEVTGSVTIKSMQLVAAAMDCTFIYSFIPTSTLEATIRCKARKLAEEQLKRISHTMDLEAQSMSTDWIAMQVDEITQEILRKSWKHLWEQ